MEEQNPTGTLPSRDLSFETVLCTNEVTKVSINQLITVHLKDTKDPKADWCFLF